MDIVTQNAETQWEIIKKHIHWLVMSSILGTHRLTMQKTELATTHALASGNAHCRVIIIYSSSISYILEQLWVTENFRGNKGGIKKLLFSIHAPSLYMPWNYSTSLSKPRVWIVGFFQVGKFRAETTLLVKPIYIQ